MQTFLYFPIIYKCIINKNPWVSINKNEIKNALLKWIEECEKITFIFYIKQKKLNIITVFIIRDDKWWKFRASLRKIFENMHFSDVFWINAEFHQIIIKFLNNPTKIIYKRSTYLLPNFCTNFYNWTINLKPELERHRGLRRSTSSRRAGKGRAAEGRKKKKEAFPVRQHISCNLCKTAKAPLPLWPSCIATRKEHQRRAPEAAQPLGAVWERAAAAAGGRQSRTGDGKDGPRASTAAPLRPPQPFS